MTSNVIFKTLSLADPYVSIQAGALWSGSGGRLKNVTNRPIRTGTYTLKQYSGLDQLVVAPGTIATCGGIVQVYLITDRVVKLHTRVYDVVSGG